MSPTDLPENELASRQAQDLRSMMISDLGFSLCDTQDIIYMTNPKRAPRNTGESFSWLLGLSGLPWYGVGVWCVSYKGAIQIGDFSIIMFEARHELFPSELLLHCSDQRILSKTIRGTHDSE